MRVVDLDEMKEIENLARTEYGLSESLIIENVGIRSADFIEAEYLLEDNFGELIFLIGNGNNGADGLAIARNLTNRGHTCRAFILFPEEKQTSENEKQLKLARAFGVKISEIHQNSHLTSYFTQTQDRFLVVDAILGTGFRAPLSNYLFEIINLVNTYASVQISVDIPSGVSGATGEFSGTAVKADTTMVVSLPKVGHYIGKAPVFIGNVVTIDSGIPKALLSGGDKSLLNHESVSSFYSPRNKLAHKSNFGHCLAIGGSEGLMGALIMASQGALKVGTGLVTAITWPKNFEELSSRVPPEIMYGKIPYEETVKDRMLKEMDRYDSMLLGPGMGVSTQTKVTVEEALNSFSGPIILDADAIKVLSLKEHSDLIGRRKGVTILTPHIGEFARFIGVTIEDVLNDPINLLKETIDKLNCCIILKSSCSYIGFPNGEIFINYLPNDGMASGGSGDVLAGIVAGLLAQCNLDRKKSGMFADQSKVYNAVCLAVAVHTLAGKHAAENLGVRSMTALSIVDHLSNAFNDMDSWSI